MKNDPLESFRVMPNNVVHDIYEIDLRFYWIDELAGRFCFRLREMRRQDQTSLVSQKFDSVTKSVIDLESSLELRRRAFLLMI